MKIIQEKSNNTQGLLLRFVNVVLPVIMLILCMQSIHCLAGSTGVVQLQPQPSDKVDGVIWMQASSEYKAVCRQTYRSAQAILKEAMRDTTWSAALEQTTGFHGLPPAVILDVDETVLDNGRFQGEMIRRGEFYDHDVWEKWVMTKSAEAVEGALEYVRAASALGITVIYLTNRECRPMPEYLEECPQQTATIANLIALGFPVQDADCVMLKSEQPGWKSEKSSRRAYVAKKYRILQIVGDDLGDFIPNVKYDITPEERLRKTRAHDPKWGRRWFMLPNPHTAPG